jgi:large subunit ribosomal protein L24
MKAKFKTSWNASKQPRKQRKYLANAPLHVKRKLLSVNLSKALRKEYGVRNVEVRKGDSVKIMRGKFKKQSGKVTLVSTKYQKIFIENIQAKKMDGSKVNVPSRASNLQIIALDTNDKKRKINKKNKEEQKQTPKKAKSNIKKENKE